MTNERREADTSNKRRFHIASLNPIATAGVWAYTTVANILAFRKAAAATVSVVSVALPAASKGGTFGDNALKSVAVEYNAAVAALTSAPTAICNKLSVSRTTGVVTRTAVAGALAFTGFDTTGIGVGDHVATFTPTTEQAADDEDAFVLELTMNEAATGTLAIHAATVDAT